MSKLGFFLTLLLACNLGRTERPNYAQGRVADTIKNLKIPTQAKSKVMADFISAYRSSESVRTGSLLDKDLLARFKRKALDVDAFIDNVDPVYKSSLMFEFPQGGGIVDFQSLEENKNSEGRLNVRFEVNYPAEVSMDDLTRHFRTKVYFLSNTKKLKRGGKIKGNSCHHFFEITQYFHSTLSTKGVLVSTKENDHIALLGGAFIFAFFNDDEVYMSTIGFRDSSEKSLQCQYI